MVKVKICGITSQEDALAAVKAGAWAVGFIFHKKSPRYVSPSKVRKIVEVLPPFITPVGVFVNLSERAVRDIVNFTRVQVLQFHGDETPTLLKRFKGYKIIKAFRIGDKNSLAALDQYKVDAYLFDTYKKDIEGGTGETFDWELIKGKTYQKPIILSGGLTVENVAKAKDEVKPYAVDVSSGVESSPGVKNFRLMKTFCDTVNFTPIA